MTNIDVQQWLRVGATEVQEYLRKNENEDELALVLKTPVLMGVPTSILATQLQGRRKAKHKLPGLYSTPGIIFPPELNLEQTSSETTAREKAHLLEKILPSQNLLVDLTGGFGVDALAFAKIFHRVVSVDSDVELNEIVKWNLAQMSIKNVDRVTSSAEAFLETKPVGVNCFYFDPSRRSGGKKVYAFSDCSPDVTMLLDQALELAPVVLIKGAPLLDITASIRQLRNVESVTILAVDNECKELLFVCKKTPAPAATIRSINIIGNMKDEFVFSQADEASATVEHGAVERYLYEPNAAILKGGAFRLIGSRFNLRKLSNNTHLYSSEQLKMQFPGRIFTVEKQLRSDSRSVAKEVVKSQANVLVRNYPLSAEALKKKLRLKDGGEQYVIGTSTESSKLILLCTRVK